MAVLAVSQQFVAWHAIAYKLLLAATSALGVGFGTMLLVLNTYVAQFFPGRSEVALPALHAFLGTGTALAPVLVAVFARAAAWWRLPIGIAAAFLVVVLVSQTQPLATASIGGPAHSGRLSMAHHRIPPRLVGYAIGVFLYGTCETIFGNWATIYLHGEGRVSLTVSELALTTFWAMLTAGRIAVAIVSARVEAWRIYAALPVLITIACLAIARFGSSPAAGVSAFGFAGLACSGFLPLSIGLAGQEFSGAAAAVSGALVAPTW